MGAFVGALLAPDARTRIGPLSVSVGVRPSLHPGSEVAAGAVRVGALRHPPGAGRGRRQHPHRRRRPGARGPAVRRQPARPRADRPGPVAGGRHPGRPATAVSALVGAALVGALALRTLRGAAESAALALAVVVGVGAASLATFDEDSLAAPRFSGVLDRAPHVVGQTQSLVKRLESYRAGLADFVDSVTSLYAVGTRLPTALPDETSGEVTTVLHISDIHDNPLGFDLAVRLAAQFHAAAVIDTGDVTTNGTPLEAAQLDRIGQLGVPYVFIRGNHDSVSTQAAVAAQKNAVVLDDRVTTVAGLTIAGIGDPRFTPVEGSAAPDRPEAVASSAQLAGTIRAYDGTHADDPVDIALVHDPQAADPLGGTVPVVLAGHLHKRETRTVDGTKILVEGSTGGALITSDGLIKAEAGTALPLEASLLYFAAGGPDRGRLLAYDEVTVGGLGLTSVSISRTVVRPGDVAAPQQMPLPTPSGSPSSSGPGSGSSSG